MNAKRKEPPSPPPSTLVKKPYNKNFSSRRDGLGDYILHPTKYSTSRVIFHDTSSVAIHDMYPKASVHTLLLPRSPIHSVQHPFIAFSDPVFLAQTRVQAEKLKRIVAKELQRRYGKFSALDEPRERVLNGEVDLAEGDAMPAGRAWEKEVLVGVHAHPSMNHLHIHVLSKDMHSECLKHRKHYNSFMTEFFVPLDAFPLAEDDPRRFPDNEGYLGKDMMCWRCGKSFGNKFARLKEHLTLEFDAWKRQ
jgi:aprataxin